MHLYLCVCVAPSSAESRRATVYIYIYIYIQCEYTIMGINICLKLYIYYSYILYSFVLHMILMFEAHSAKTCVLQGVKYIYTNVLVYICCSMY